jgi:hypothetical protein
MVASNDCWVGLARGGAQGHLGEEGGGGGPTPPVFGLGWSMEMGLRARRVHMLALMRYAAQPSEEEEGLTIPVQVHSPRRARGGRGGAGGAHVRAVAPGARRGLLPALRQRPVGPSAAADAGGLRAARHPREHVRLKGLLAEEQAEGVASSLQRKRLLCIGCARGLPAWDLAIKRARSGGGRGMSGWAPRGAEAELTERAPAGTA